MSSRDEVVDEERRVVVRTLAFLDPADGVVAGAEGVVDGLLEGERFLFDVPVTERIASASRDIR